MVGARGPSEKVGQASQEPEATVGAAHGGPQMRAFLTRRLPENEAPGGRAYGRQEVSNTSFAGLTTESVSRVVQVSGNSDAVGAKAGMVSGKTSREAGVVQ